MPTASKTGSPHNADMTTKLDEVRAAIIKAVPEIVELKFGCELKTSKGFYVTLIGHKDDWYTWKRHEDGLISAGDDAGDADGLPELIIGRPIRLADVLVAIDEKCPSKYFVNSNGAFIRIDTKWRMVAWKLWSDSLENQSDECIDFIHSLLCV